MLTDNYIKYQCILNSKQIEKFPEFEEINQVRFKLKNRNLIGVNPNGLSFGNISVRDGDNERFYITCSQTGDKEYLVADDFALVKKCDIDRNIVECDGLFPASSESMSHAALYDASPSIKAVIHIHSKELWNKYLYKSPTSPEDCEYGSPDLAHALRRIADQNIANTANGVIICAGHEDGIMIYSETLVSAERIIESLISGNF
jgi:hypothetical protein